MEVEHEVQRLLGGGREAEDQVLDGLHGGLQELSGAVPHTVQVSAEQRALGVISALYIQLDIIDNYLYLGVAEEDAVRVHHGHDLEDELLPEEGGHLVLGHQEVDQTLQPATNPTAKLFCGPELPTNAENACTRHYAKRALKQSRVDVNL